MEDGLADENVLPPQPVEVANDVLSNKKSKKVIEKTPKTEYVVAAFADKRGLGHNDYAYGSAKGAALDDDESDDYSELAPTNDASTKRQAIVSAELEVNELNV
ncbi:hypothetical protein AC1031_018632 [Aphanomyces cochlioides]|nr:hypothetical protein AC1031_018632 [Aphanomyces cochlioides]